MNDFESEQAIEEAATALTDHSAIAMLSLAQGETPAAVRRRLARFVAGAPPKNTRNDTTTTPPPHSHSPAVYRPAPPPTPTVRRLVPADARAPIVATIRRPTN